MGRANDSVTRVDIRFSNQMFEAIQQIAIKEGAKTHHISQKVEISPTIIKLIQLGLDALEGKLSDKDDNIPDNLSDTLRSSLPDRQTVVSGIIAEVSDKVTKSLSQSFNEGWLEIVEIKNSLSIERERVNILIRELTSKGAIDAAGSSVPRQFPSLPDKIENVPDNLSVKDDMISDRVDLLPDSLSDTKQIPSDDSSYSQSIAEEVLTTQAEAIEQVNGETLRNYSFAEFHHLLGIPIPANKTKANGEIAIAIASGKGLGDWVMDSRSRKFTKIIGN